MDGSENSHRALEYATSMAVAGDALTLVRVIDLPPTLYVESQKLLNEIMGKFKDESARILDQSRALAQKSGVAVNAVTLEGDTAQGIVDCAQKGGFDMIVMGSRGLGKLKDIVLGGVSSKVLQRAKCPVLIVK